VKVRALHNIAAERHTPSELFKSDRPCETPMAFGLSSMTVWAGLVASSFLVWKVWKNLVSQILKFFRVISTQVFSTVFFALMSAKCARHLWTPTVTLQMRGRVKGVIHILGYGMMTVSWVTKNNGV
jgi:hypothetical protein